MSCIFPFQGLFIESTMDVKFCCAGSYYLGNLKNSTLDEILNNQLSIDIREHIKKSTISPYCENCYSTEKRGAQSQRIPIESQNYQKIIDNEYKVCTIDIRWSNTCNLACTYCLPHFSSKWANVLSIKINNSTTEIIEKIFTFIEKNKNDIEKVMLLGGEPLLLKENSRLLEILDNVNEYCLLSNLTQPIENNSIAKELLSFKNKVSWGASAENIEERFEYVRFGGKWEIFKNNLKFLLTNNYKVSLFPMYSIYCAFNLVELYEFIDEIKIPNVYWQTMSLYPLRVENLPKEFIESAVNEINLVLNQFSDSPGINDLKNIKESLLSLESFSSDIETLKWTHDLETNKFPRKKNFKDLWPELYLRMSEYGKL